MLCCHKSLGKFAMPKAVKTPPKVSGALPSRVTQRQSSESAEASGSSKRKRKADTDQREEVGGVAWISILFVSLAALVAAYWLAFQVGTDTAPQQTLFYILCSIGLGGVVRAFGGSAEMNWQGWLKCSGIAALILAPFFALFGFPASKDPSTGSGMNRFEMERLVLVALDGDRSHPVFTVGQLASDRARTLARPDIRGQSVYGSFDQISTSLSRESNPMASGKSSHANRGSSRRAYGPRSAGLALAHSDDNSFLLD
jgi:hypothetical protein